MEEMKSVIVFKPIPGKRKESDEMLKRFSERLDQYERDVINRQIGKSVHEKTKT